MLWKIKYFSKHNFFIIDILICFELSLYAANDGCSAENEKRCDKKLRLIKDALVQ